MKSEPAIAWKCVSLVLGLSGLFKRALNIKNFSTSISYFTLTQ